MGELITFIRKSIFWIFMFFCTIFLLPGLFWRSMWLSAFNYDVYDMSNWGWVIFISCLSLARSVTFNSNGYKGIIKSYFYKTFRYIAMIALFFMILKFDIDLKWFFHDEFKLFLKSIYFAVVVS